MFHDDAPPRFTAFRDTPADVSARTAADQSLEETIQWISKMAGYGAMALAIAGILAVFLT
ncbi:hypothetical protein AEB_P0071 [Altererythrobacter sp. B11]|uniref:hypothetical protein n=1 Tax=Altererythrobacter sp. B11 TaxID=2060312 RepID=UPI000DC6DA98|nr:hypothetical protein [Altererythrobacter sp. B11]BBC70939.1 hypothetical protein AEB_P0071 [Altererythrobacter sp. B11]